MNARSLLMPLLMGASFAVVSFLPMRAALAGHGSATGQTTTSTGSPSTRFDFAGETPALSAAATQHPAFALVALPPWHEAKSLSHEGDVLLYDWNAGEFFRWRNGQLHPLHLGTYDRINKLGDILRRNPDGTYLFEKANGTVTPVIMDEGPLGEAWAVDFNDRFAVGFIMTARDEQGFLLEQTPVKWDFNGTIEILAPPVHRSGTRTYHPAEVNRRGDFMAWLSEYDSHGNFSAWTNLNQTPIPGINGVNLNNHGAILGQLATDDPTGMYPTAFWNGTTHPLGETPLIAVSVNDRDEILTFEFLPDGGGNSTLWQPARGTGNDLAFTPTDLAAATGLNLKVASLINNDGVILADAWNEAGEFQAHLLVPVSDRLGVDFNRDGKIDTTRLADNPDQELTRRGLPWYFWVNDDNDSGETEGTDIPGGGSNGTNGTVNGVRDLVDFFPVHLDIARLLREYPPSETAVAYKLTQADGAANFLITDLTPDTVGRYHREPEFARTLDAAPVTQITAPGVLLDRDFLSKTLNEGKGIILVEARKATRAPLRLEIWKDNDLKESVELPLSFDGVETMFRHRNLVDAVAVLPEPYAANRPGAPNWPDELNNDQAFVFVHGYNVNQKQARGWNAEFFKRIWWTGSKAQFWGVTWYGSDSQIVLRNVRMTPDYQVNVVHAFGAAPFLARFLHQLKQPGIGTISVAGHSLGNMVVSSAITDHAAPIDRYFMLDAAVAAEAYDGALSDAAMPHTEWVNEFGGVYPAVLWAANWHLLFGSEDVDKRAALTWRNRFAPKPGIEYYDFYSTGEEVLDHTDARSPSVPGILAQIGINKFSEFLHIDLPFSNGQPPGHRVWQLQEQLKGRNITDKYGGSNYGGWGFNTFDFRKFAAGSAGRGPALVPTFLRADEITPAMLSSVFTPEALREEPFFRPGRARKKVRTWQYGDGRNSLLEDRLGLLYDRTRIGSDFAQRHRNALLARMIPALSPAAGRVPVPRFTAETGQERNFDMNGATIRPQTDAENNPVWPTQRENDYRWWHSDLREVAYPFVQELYQKLSTLSSSLAATP